MRKKLKIALGLAAAATFAFGAAAPASAAAGSGLTFWSGWFTGKTAVYPNPSTSCTTLPFSGRALLNDTDRTLRLYKTPDCSGRAITIPATDIRNFSEDIRSFRATG